jgi:iron complex outermembrane receptor protein
LTRAQWEANPQQANPLATAFNTRKTVNQTQGGVTVDQKLTYDSVLRATGYGGTRTVRQYLAFPGDAAASSGGVPDLDRSFGGIDARWVVPVTGLGGPFRLTIGADYETQSEARKGYVNNAGELGPLRRDEDNTVTNSDVYAQLEWSPGAAVSILAGIRYSDVRFKSDDHYIVAGNPDDSGSVTYRHTSPVIGAVWHVREDLNVYANYGQGFETPTFTELAYRRSAAEPRAPTGREHVGGNRAQGDHRRHASDQWCCLRDQHPRRHRPMLPPAAARRTRTPRRPSAAVSSFRGTVPWAPDSTVTRRTPTSMPPTIRR